MSQDERRLFPVRRDRGALDEQTPESSSRGVNRRAMISREFPRQVLLFVCQVYPSAARYSFVSTRRSDSWKVGAEVRIHDGCRDDNLTHK